MHLEIEMVVTAASRIELLAATWAARLALHVLMDGELLATGTTEYRSLIPFSLRPDLKWVIGERSVAVFTGVVDATAPHLDGDNVSGLVIVLAPSLRIKIDATNFWKSRNHRASTKTTTFNQS
jgi:hypothetical protein